MRLFVRSLVGSYTTAKKSVYTCAKGINSKTSNTKFQSDQKLRKLTKMIINFIVIGLAFVLSKVNAATYAVPKARIEVLHPKGFSVSIPDTPGIQMFAFHGNLNSPMDGLEAGQFSADILKHKNGRWTYVNRKHEIKPGDVMYYWLYVQKDSLGYRRDDQKHEFTESDVYGGNNSTEENSTEGNVTDRPIQPQQPPRGTSVNDNCNASTPPMRVFPQEVHHHHHHYLPTIPGCSPPPSPGYPGAGGTGGAYPGNFNYPGTGGPGAGSTETLQSLSIKMREVMAALESMKLRVSTLSDVVDELINSNSNAKLLLTGAKVDSKTNLFELVRHVILDMLDLKDLKNDIYSATRTKEGIVFDVASGLDKRRILARARERFRDDEELRIQNYYDGETKSDDDETEAIIDSRFGE